MTSPASKLQAVILDWAGTTVDFGSLAPAVVLLRLFGERGVEISVAEARRDMGLLKLDHIRAILRAPRVAEEWRRKYGVTAGESEADSLFADFIPRQLDILAEHSALIPGVAEAVSRMRARGLKIGTTTGYTRPMLDLLVSAAAAQGYSPDCALCPDDVGGGRPYPWMCFETALRLKVFPLSAIVKIGDTESDMDEGRNAGMWTVGVAETGNCIGLGESDWQVLPAAVREQRLNAARKQLYDAGAHYVIDRVSEFDGAFDQIRARLAHGDKP